ncbi:uncharacterized protein [Pleurodeles waltl]
MQKDPQHYLSLLNQLHATQERMLTLIAQISEQCIPQQLHRREYQMKFPDDLLNDNMSSQMLFAAELLVSGTYIEVAEADGIILSPLARDVLYSLEELRTLLREQSLTDPSTYTESIHKALIQFDALSAEFELRYVSLVVSVKTPEEIFKQQEIVVLFCETITRALKLGYLTQDMIDVCEPQLMFTIPRLSIISGLLIYPDGPLNLQRRREDMSKLFSPFYGLLKKIRDLLYVLSEEELFALEKSLCSTDSEDPQSNLTGFDSPQPETTDHNPEPHLASLIFQTDMSILVDPQSNLISCAESSESRRSSMPPTTTVELQERWQCNGSSQSADFGMSQHRSALGSSQVVATSSVKVLTNSEVFVPKAFDKNIGEVQRTMLSPTEWEMTKPPVMSQCIPYFRKHGDEGITCTAPCCSGQCYSELFVHTGASQSLPGTTKDSTVPTNQNTLPEVLSNVHQWEPQKTVSKTHNEVPVLPPSHHGGTRESVYTKHDTSTENSDSRIVHKNPLFHATCHNTSSLLHHNSVSSRSSTVHSMNTQKTGSSQCLTNTEALTAIDNQKNSGVQESSLCHGDTQDSGSGLSHNSLSPVYQELHQVSDYPVHCRVSQDSTYLEHIEIPQDLVSRSSVSQGTEPYMHNSAPQDCAFLTHQGVPHVSASAVDQEVPQTSASPLHQGVSHVFASTMHWRVPLNSASQIHHKVPQHSVSPVHHEVPQHSASPVHHEVPRDSASPMHYEFPQDHDIPQHSTSSRHYEFPQGSVSPMHHKVPRDSAAPRYQGPLQGPASQKHHKVHQDSSFSKHHKIILDSSSPMHHTIHQDSTSTMHQVVPQVSASQEDLGIPLNSAPLMHHRFPQDSRSPALRMILQDSASTMQQVVPHVSASSMNMGAPLYCASPMHQEASHVPASPMHQGVPQKSASQMHHKVSQVSAPRIHHKVPQTSASPMHHKVPQDSASPMHHKIPQDSASTMHHKVPQDFASPMHHKDPDDFASTMHQGFLHVPSSSVQWVVPQDSVSHMQNKVPQDSAALLHHGVPPDSASLMLHVVHQDCASPIHHTVPQDRASTLHNHIPQGRTFSVHHNTLNHHWMPQDSASSIHQCMHQESAFSTHHGVAQDSASPMKHWEPQDSAASIHHGVPQDCASSMLPLLSQDCTSPIDRGVPQDSTSAIYLGDPPYSPSAKHYGTSQDSGSSVHLGESLNTSILNHSMVTRDCVSQMHNRTSQHSASPMYRRVLQVFAYPMHYRFPQGFISAINHPDIVDYPLPLHHCGSNLDVPEHFAQDAAFTNSVGPPIAAATSGLPHTHLWIEHSCVVDNFANLEREMLSGSSWVPGLTLADSGNVNLFAPATFPARDVSRNSVCSDTALENCQTMRPQSRTIITFSRHQQRSSKHNDELSRRGLQEDRKLMRREIRSRYRSTRDMLHRLFVCIAGVADQLQTNFASDLRPILKTVFEIAASKSDASEISDAAQNEIRTSDLERRPGKQLEDCALCSDINRLRAEDGESVPSANDPPEWIPDSACSNCMDCRAQFTLVRRRHHCRSCGKIFCSRCSAHMVPLPHFGHSKAVRVCNHCFTSHLYSWPEAIP